MMVRPLVGLGFATSEKTLRNVLALVENTRGIRRKRQEQTGNRRPVSTSVSAVHSVSIVHVSMGREKTHWQRLQLDADALQLRRVHM